MRDSCAPGGLELVNVPNALPFDVGRDSVARQDDSDDECGLR